MKIIPSCIGFLFASLITVYGETVYLRILNYGDQDVQVRFTGIYPNGHQITDNKKFWKNNDRIQINYRSSDSNHMYRSGNSQYQESNSQRQVGTCGFVTYQASSNLAIHDVQIELTMNREAVANGIRLEVSKDYKFNKATAIRLDTSEFYISGNNVKLNAFIDFATAKAIYNGDQYAWSGARFADRFGMAECYWYGFVKPFSYQAEVDYWKYNSTEFFMDGMLHGQADSGYFGVDLEWRHPLDEGYEYTFTTVVRTPPDYILINNEKLVWEKGKDFFAATSGELVFYYTPETDETVSISYVKNASREKRRLHLDGGYWQELYATRRPLKDPVTYPERSIEKQFIPIEHPVLTMHPSFHDEPAPALNLETLKELPYPVADFHILPRGALAAVNQVYDVVEKLNISGAVFEPNAYGNRYFQQEDFTVYRNAGVKNMDFLVFEKQNGKIAKINPHWHSYQLYDSNPVETTSGLMKQWLELDEDNKAYIHLQEVNCLFGSWGKNIFSTGVLSDYGYTNLGGKTVQEMFQLHIDEISAFLDRMEEKTGYQDRVMRLLLPDRASLNPAYWVRSGADIIVMKNIHRQSVNVVVSGARGMAEAYGIEYGFDADLWDRCTRLGYHPDEFVQVFKSYFHAGGAYLIEEGFPQVPDQGVFSNMGRYWVDMGRYARSHPPLGDQVVQVAVMRGFGDEWHTVASPSSSWESGYYEKTVEGVNYLRDYNLLDILFADYGTYWNTAPERLCTGTPFGPVDFIPWEAPPEILNKYKLIVIMGFNTLQEEHMINLTDYVRQGGKVICAAGQVRSHEGTFHLTEELFGVEPGERLSVTLEQPSLIPGKNSLEYELQSQESPYYFLDLAMDSAEVLDFLPDQSPLLVSNRFGQGKAYLFAGLSLTEFGEELPRRIMEEELEEIRPLSMFPYSDRIEYMVRRKGNSIILPVFNHGNAGFPSGNYREGEWSGQLTLDREAFGIPDGAVAGYRAVYNEQENSVDLVNIPLTANGETIIIDTSIDTFEEFVIGPLSEAEEDFYR
jgi:hypothetical protein